MRLKIRTSPNMEVVPFAYQEGVVAKLHEWTGYDRELHESLSLYSFSWLRGSKMVQGGYHFDRGASFFISAHDKSLLMKIALAICNDSGFICGMKIESVLEENYLFEKEKQLFKLASPILIRRTLQDKTAKHYTFEDPECSNFMRETLKRKAEKAGVNFPENTKVYFDLSYKHKKTKMASYKGIKNRCNSCPITIESSLEVIQFAWNVGIGNSTGIGFGSLL